MGLGYWQMMRLIILPQALKVTIPNIVNTYIGFVQGYVVAAHRRHFRLPEGDRNRTHRSAMGGPTTSSTGYAFAALVYFLFCYGMASYARSMERRLSVADKR